RRGSGNRKRIRRQLAREWRKVRNRRRRRVVLVNPAGTSITCHACGQRCTRPRQDTVICPRCGPWDADVNGARNIYARAGLGSGQAAPPA
ncbi:MAG: transposase, partial [Actinobacteria bacterium]|nr:transposase [Actinomycetota bacterium]